ncbi:MAG: polyphosphate kinase 2 family protein, partial [Gemmiger sp.]
TGTAAKHSPWYVLPADQKWYTRYLVSQVVVEALKQCSHEYPVLSDEGKAALADSRARLMQES